MGCLATLILEGVPVWVKVKKKNEIMVTLTASPLLSTQLYLSFSDTNTSVGKATDYA